MLSYADVNRVLLEELGDLPDSLYSDTDLVTANKLWLKRSFLKKFEGLSGRETDQRALDLFIEANESCKSFQFKPESRFEELVIGEVKSLIDSMFFRGPELLFSLDTLFQDGGVGPGASLESHTDDFYTKLFAGPMSATNPLLPHYYNEVIRSCPSWFRAEMARKTAFGLTFVEGNRLSFVPKTPEVSRTICTEPSLNMFFQKWIGAFLERQLWRKFRIDLSKQPELNRKLACKGSIDGSFGTIDLSSASDTIALDLVRQIFPDYFVRWIERARSPRVILPDGTSRELYMVSSMGNGFTFPLETTIFATIVIACYRILGIKPEVCDNEPCNYGVFGDDIIVRKDAYEFVIKCLKLFGFRVNEDKSYNSGYFRESCGGDYWAGSDIRGVYLRNLKTGADVYSLINRLVRWSTRSGFLLWKTISLLRSGVRNLPIPWEAGDSEGIKVPYPPLFLPRKKDTGGVCYRYLSTKSVRLRLPEDETKTVRYPSKGRNKRFFYNSEGILQSVLGGYVRAGKLSYRLSDNPRFQIRVRCTSSWYGHTVGLLDRGHAWQSVAALLLDLWE